MSAFKIIKEKNIDHLIIDIRGNCGGDDSWNKGILPYIADKPWRLGSKYKVKVLEGQASEGEKVGDVIDGENSMKSVASESAFRFTGELSVLVDGFTYSSSILFVNVIQYFNFSTVVGNEIGGKRGQTGGTKRLILSHSKLKVVSPRFLLERPKGGGNLDTVIIDKHISYDPTQSDDLIEKLLKGK